MGAVQWLCTALEFAASSPAGIDETAGYQVLRTELYPRVYRVTRVGRAVSPASR